MAILDAVGERVAPPGAPSALRDTRIETVIAGIKAAYRRPTRGGPNRSTERDPHAYAEYGFCIHPDQGELIYLLCRA
ncbi:MAG: hypothetical protein ABI843_04370 [Dokdonella sp.]